MASDQRDGERQMYWSPDGEPMTQEEWSVAFGLREINGLMRAEAVGDAEVSTVWLGLDHSFGVGRPLVWETMIFGGSHDQAQFRYSTREEADAGHARVLAALRDGRDPEADDA